MELDPAVFFTAPVALAGWVLGLALLAGLLFLLLRLAIAAALRQVLEEEAARFAQVLGWSRSREGAGVGGAATSGAAQDTQGDEA